MHTETNLWEGPHGDNKMIDDKAGDERLDLHAQHDYHRLVLHDSFVTVKHDDFLTVDHNKTDVIKWAYSMSAGRTSLSTGPYLLLARTIKEGNREGVRLREGGRLHPPRVRGELDPAIGYIVIKSPQVQVDGGGHIIMQAGVIDLNP